MLLLKHPTGAAPPPETDLLVLGGFGRGFSVARGQLLTIEDVRGGQVGALIAYTRADAREFLSPHHTRVFGSTFVLRLGTRLTTNRRRPMFVLGRDPVGGHDLLLPACDRFLYEGQGQAEHRSCVQNFEEVLREAQLVVPKIPDPVNLFMNVALSTDGRLTSGPPRSKAGDSVTFRALIDAFCILSACPREVPSGVVRAPTELRVRVHNRLEE